MFPAPHHPVSLDGSSLGLLPSRGYQHGAVVTTSADYGSIHLAGFSLLPLSEWSLCFPSKTVAHFTQNLPTRAKLNLQAFYLPAISSFFVVVPPLPNMAADPIACARFHCTRSTTTQTHTRQQLATYPTSDNGQRGEAGTGRRGPVITERGDKQFWLVLHPTDDSPRWL